MQFTASGDHRSREEARLQALRSYNILDTLEEADFDELAQLASAICRMPVALISLVDHDRQWFKSHVGIDARQTPIEQSFCAHAIVSGEDIMIVDDASRDRRFSDNPLVVGDPKIVFYAGVPLINEEGYPLGTLCVIDNRHSNLDEEQKAALKILGKQVVAKLELRRKISQLRKSEDSLHQLNDELKAANNQLANSTITQHRLLEQLTESEIKARLLVKDAPVAIGVLAGPSFIIESANSMLLDLWGKDESVVGKRLEDVLPTLEEQGFLQLLSNVYQSGTPFYGNRAKALLERNGKMQEDFYNFVYNPVRNSAGETVSIMIVANQITEQVKAQQIVEESEQKFRSLIEQAPFAVIVFRTKELIIDAINPMMLQLLGMDHSIAGRPLLEVIPELKGQHAYEMFHHVYDTGETYTGYETPVTYITDEQEEHRFYNFTYSPLLENGKIVGIIDTAVDVTEQVNHNAVVAESEEKFRTMAEASDVLISISDEHKNGIYYNRAWTELTGKSSLELIEFGWNDLIHPGDLERWLKTVDTAYENEVSLSGEVRLKGRNGEYRWLLAKMPARYRTDGSFAGYINSFIDITEQRKDDQRKNDFISMVSHELKTPLTTLSGYVQLMQMVSREHPVGSFNEMLEKSGSQIKKMGTLINGFLDVSRFETGKIYLQMANFDLNKLIEEIIDEAVPTATRHKIIFQPAGEIAIHADRDKIGQVINNLISNAIKYSPNGGDIVICCNQSNENVVVSIKDHGIGIPEYALQNLFDRFYRVHDGMPANISGFGIGLYLSSEIIQRHCGRIWVESQPANGSTFYFSLPGRPENIQ